MARKLLLSEARSLNHPHFPNIQKHTFLVPAHRLPKNIPQKANLREATGLNRAVYKDARESSRGKEALPGTFDLLNLGIPIIAEKPQSIFELDGAFQGIKNAIAPLL